MGMITSSIRIVPDLKLLTAKDLSAPAGGNISSAFGPGGGGGGLSPRDARLPPQGCCGATPGKFANGRIPTDTIQIAKRTAEGHVADIVVDANGYTPAVIVMQRGMKGKVRFVAGSLSSCNSFVKFPE